MTTLQELLVQNQDIQAILNGITAKMKKQLVTGLSDSARSLLAAGVYDNLNTSIVIVTHNLLQAQKVADELSGLLPKAQVQLFPANDILAAEMSISSPELRAQRLEVMNYFSKNSSGILVVPLAGVTKIIPSADQWLESQLHLQVGSIIDPLELISKLVAIGYTRSHMITSYGEFSVRGEIIDIYPLSEENPIRIEFFDDEIDSIRYFSIENQRSITNIQHISINPATEIVANAGDLEQLSIKLQHLLKTADKIKVESTKQQLQKFIASECECLRNGIRPLYISRYTSLIYKKTATILDYLPQNKIVFLDDISRINEQNLQLELEGSSYSTSLLEKGELLPDTNLTHSFSMVIANIKSPIIYLSLFLRNIPNTTPQNIVNFSCNPMQKFHGQFQQFKSSVSYWLKNKQTIVIQCDSADRIKKVSEILDDLELRYTITTADEIINGALQLTIGSLLSGFELPMQKIIVITEQELLNSKKTKSYYRHKLSNAERIKSYDELSIGDYVVHINHGIGKYTGIETLLIDGVHKDFLNILYSGTDKLFVPIEQIGQIQKYVGTEERKPKLYKLGGSEWKKVKNKVATSVHDIADELLKISAARKMSKGFAFSPDTKEQMELESSFSYVETEDQLRSIAEIKADMELERPMDRLLCGDVGYGKTEVAVRAAFKAIVDGKQVAFLVPTTILAQQHFDTLSLRFQDFPVNIGLMSRFRTKKQQVQTAKELKLGLIDIVVGTHRILSKDISFKDLGLLIVDEEQRFGVRHKERIKQLKANIDVLTLTATPIPRTLHMSMLGVRDLSVIETPPENRFPIQTYVLEFSKHIIRDVIERELARSGQVFFLHNRVDDISRQAHIISELVPSAKVTYAHGQMSESELESIIYSFINGEYDVLVCTTIIETGVDIPNANTLIVNNADQMGLSQLYQLRGRVGRSSRLAYAYFTYKRGKVLTEVAEKRLQSIKEFTELGSGFKIAMRDLSIRGAGNILGAQQHGFINSVGFDMYSHMLESAIKKLQCSEEIKEPREVILDVGIDAYIPETYIKNSNHKIEMYKLFSRATSISELDDLCDELIDRFGDYPPAVSNLIALSKLKVLGLPIGVVQIQQSNENEILAIFDNVDQFPINIFNSKKVFSEKEITLTMLNNKIQLLFRPSKSFSNLHEFVSYVFAQIALEISGKNTSPHDNFC